MREAKRNVALARLSQFEQECDWFGALAHRNPHRKQELVDCLHEIASAHSLFRVHGGNLIEGLIAAGLEAR
jgi:hypothetical protein